MKALIAFITAILLSGSAMAVFEVLHDDFNIARLSSAVSLVSLGRYDDELAEDPDNGPWLEKADLLLTLREYEEAIICYNETLEREKTADYRELTIYAANGKGLAFIYLGKRAEAISLLKRFLEEVGDEPIPIEFVGGPYLHNTLGIAYYREGEYAEAYFHFNVAHNYISEEVRPLVAYNCAAAFARQDNKDMMLPYVEEFCRLSVGDIAAGRIFEDGEPVSTDIELSKHAKEDEAFKEYWNDPEFIGIVDK